MLGALLSLQSSIWLFLNSTPWHKVLLGAVFIYFLIGGLPYFAIRYIDSKGGEFESGVSQTLC